MTSLHKPLTWFWVVSALALLWNGMGVMAYIQHVTMTPEALAALPEAERVWYDTVPVWANAAFAAAVFGGFLGCLLLLLRNGLAKPVLLLSLLGILLQMFHAFFISNSIEVYGPGGMIMPLMVILIGMFLVWLANTARKRGWIS